jgi:lipopolysaccharide transport system permease protein
MSVEYRDISATVEAGVLRLRFRLVNRSRKAWRAGADSAGWQIYDPATHLFISEGEWLPLPRDVAPGESCEVRIDIPLPEDAAGRRVYVSPVFQDRGWAYVRGSKFIAADIAGAAVEKVRVTTLARLRLELLPRLIRELFTAPVASLWKNRRLVQSMVRRDIHARYRGSAGDLFWAVLSPLLLMLTYAFVFGVVLETRFWNDDSPAGFVLYFLAGMMPWLPVGEALARAPHAIVEHRNFVKKLLFPVEIIPATQVVTALVTQAVALVIFMSFIIIFREWLPWTILWLPALIIPQVLLTLGLAWFLSALGVFLRDLSQLMGFLLTLWFFMTPICYPEQKLPAWGLPLLGKNPIYILVRGFRGIFLENRAPEFDSLWKLYALSVLLFFLGFAWFRKLRKSFPDVL